MKKCMIICKNLSYFLSFLSLWNSNFIKNIIKSVFYRFFNNSVHKILFSDRISLFCWMRTAVTCCRSSCLVLRLISYRIKKSLILNFPFYNRNKNLLHENMIIFIISFHIEILSNTHQRGQLCIIIARDGTNIIGERIKGGFSFYILQQFPNII